MLSLFLVAYPRQPVQLYLQPAYNKNTSYKAVAFKQTPSNSRYAFLLNARIINNIPLVGLINIPKL